MDEKIQQRGKVEAPKVPRTTPAPSKKWLWLNRPCGEPQGTVAGDKGRDTIVANFDRLSNHGAMNEKEEGMIVGINHSGYLVLASNYGLYSLWVHSELWYARGYAKAVKGVLLGVNNVP